MQKGSLSAHVSKAGVNDAATPSKRCEEKPPKYFQSCFPFKTLGMTANPRLNLEEAQIGKPNRTCFFWFHPRGPLCSFCAQPLTPWPAEAAAAAAACPARNGGGKATLHQATRWVHRCGRLVFCVDVFRSWCGGAAQEGTSAAAGLAGFPGDLLKRRERTPCRGRALQLAQPSRLSRLPPPPVPPRGFFPPLHATVPVTSLLTHWPVAGS